MGGEIPEEGSNGPQVRSPSFRMWVVAEVAGVPVVITVGPIPGVQLTEIVAAGGGLAVDEESWLPTSRTMLLYDPERDLAVGAGVARG